MRLILNDDRVWLRGAAQTARGWQAAQSNEPLGREWADAAAADAAEVDEILFNANKERSEARAKAKIGWK